VCRSAAGRCAAPHIADSVDQFLRNKRVEWEDYRRQVTEYERKRYLAVL
jgi:glutamine synthetase